MHVREHFVTGEPLPLVRLNVVKLLMQDNFCVFTACATEGMCSADGSCKHPPGAHFTLA